MSGQPGPCYFALIQGSLALDRGLLASLTAQSLAIEACNTFLGFTGMSGKQAIPAAKPQTMYAWQSTPRYFMSDNYLS